MKKPLLYVGMLPNFLLLSDFVLELDRHRTPPLRRTLVLWKTSTMEQLITVLRLNTISLFPRHVHWLVMIGPSPNYEFSTSGFSSKFMYLRIVLGGIMAGRFWSILTLPTFVVSERSGQSSLGLATWVTLW